MSDAQPSKASLSDIAKAAGISKMTVSLALRNRPGVKKATRDRVLRIAKELNYVPDARFASWMERLRDTKSKGLLPIAWLNTHSEEDAWHKWKFYSPYLDGAKEVANDLGYRIEEIWAGEPGVTMKRISQILYQRGIEGVILTPPAIHLRLKWDYLACVCLEDHLLAPAVHRVRTDQTANLLLMLKILKKHGYRRIGICLEKYFAGYSSQSFTAVIGNFLATIPKSERVQPLYYPWISGTDTEPADIVAPLLKAWVQRQKPDVIIGHSSVLVELLERAGHRVPEDIGVVHLAIDEDVSDWAGIHSNRKEIGAASVSWVISLIRNRQFGVPKNPLTILVPGKWSPGCTLLTTRKFYVK